MVYYSLEHAYTYPTQSPSCTCVRFVQLSKHCSATVTNPALSSELLENNSRP